MSTIDQQEVENFSRQAALWWDPRGPFRPLHKFNPVRLDFIRAEVGRHFGRTDSAAPFAGLKLLDVGCGGGLLAEPMARLGASVTAIDASEKNIGTARAHAAGSRLAIDYRCTPIEALDPAAGDFDVILNMEVVEHVADPRLFLESCYGRLNPGGIMILATLNRTIKAYALAIAGAEYVLGWLPRGTHDWTRFLKPEDARALLSATSARIRGPYGVSYNPFLDRWNLSADTAVNYMLVIEKPD